MTLAPERDPQSYRLDGPVKAVYLPQAIPAFRGNPFIEALPPILDRLGAAQAMQNVIEVTEEELALPPEVRLHMLGAIERFVQPLSAHIELESHISSLLRWGYVERNPLKPGFLKHLLSASVRIEADEEAARSHDSGRGKGSGLTLLGQSGVGKTTAIEAVLRTVPQGHLPSPTAGSAAVGQTAGVAGAVVSARRFDEGAVPRLLSQGRPYPGH